MNESGDGSDSAEQRPVWAWIDRAALAHNARRAVEAARGRNVIGVVKADGYGHGAETIARGLLAAGVTKLAVVSVAEGAVLRRAGIVAPILLLGGLDDADQAERAVKWGLIPVLHDDRGLELARRFGRPGAPLSVEVEIDTGMSRMGVRVEHAVAFLERIVSARELTVAGVFTHLACGDEPDPGSSREQVARFGQILEAWKAPADAEPELHISNSAGLLRLAELEESGALASAVSTTAVRPGLMLYGLSPYADRSAESLDLEPVMSLAARVVAVRRIEQGDPVGYGSEWRAPHATTIATLPLGYADGLPRSLLGRGEVHLAGVMRPIVGRVSMDSVCVDVGDDPVDVGEIATIFGRTPEGESVPVEALARAAGTIGYEIVAGVGARVPRWVGTGRPPGETPDRPLLQAVKSKV